MIRRGLVGIVLLVLTGCAGIPVQQEAASARAAASGSESIVERFRTGVPDNFHLLSSIVFEYNFHSFSALGYLEIDSATGTYKVVCMNQLGVKLFEFQGDRQGLTSQYAIEPLARRGNIGSVVSEDIRRIYLDLVPSREARVTAGKHTVTFRQRSGAGALEYDFSRADLNLVRKTFREDQRAIWRVSYQEYRMQDGKLFPTRVEFRNFRHGYRLIVRVKEIRS